MWDGGTPHAMGCGPQLALAWTEAGAPCMGTSGAGYGSSPGDRGQDHDADLPRFRAAARDSRVVDRRRTVLEPFVTVGALLWLRDRAARRRISAVALVVAAAIAETGLALRVPGVAASKRTEVLS